MNTLEEQAELTQAKLDGVEIGVSSINSISNKWHPMENDYFNFQYNVYRIKPREPRVIWMNDCPNSGTKFSDEYASQERARGAANSECIGQVRFVEDLDWKGGEE